MVSRKAFSPESDRNAPVLPARTLLFYVLAIAATWGTAFAFIRILAIEGIPPLVIATYRGLLTAVALLAWLAILRRGAVRLDRTALQHMAVLGLLNGLIPNVLTAMALGEMASAPAALLQASTPLFVAVVAPLVVEGERLSSRGVVGLLLGFAGVFLLADPGAVIGGRASALGVAEMLGAALSYALATVYLRRTRPADPAAIALGQQVFAAMPAALLILIIYPMDVWVLPAEGWASLVGLAVVATAIPMVLYFRLVALVPAGKAASVQYVLPLAATLYGVVLLGEALPPHALFGGGIVLLGVWAVSASGSKPDGASRR